MIWRRLTAIVLMVGLTMGSSGTLNGSSLDRRARDGQFMQIMYCEWDGFDYVCWVATVWVEDTVEVVALNSRVDITPGGWGVDPRNGNCTDCMTPFEQYKNEPPPEPVIDEQSACQDERDIIRAEYMTGAMANVYVPACGDFSTGGGTTSFSWAELNQSPGSGHPPWGIVKSELWTALEHTKNEYQDQAITIGSGYRCPHGNSAVGGTSQSRHMHGDAADMKRAASLGTWDEDQFDLLKAAATRAGFTFFLDWNSYPSHHLHADLR